MTFTRLQDKSNTTSREPFKMSRLIELLIFCSFLNQSLGQDPIGCYVSGECRQSLVLDTVDEVDSPFECLQLCLDYEENDRTCGYFTYYLDAKVRVFLI